MKNPNPDFPWGMQNPPGGFQVGDYVGLIYSDHEEYVFDEPKGVVTKVEPMDWDESVSLITVEVEAAILSDRVYLIKRKDQSA